MKFLDEERNNAKTRKGKKETKKTITIIDRINIPLPNLQIYIYLIYIYYMRSIHPIQEPLGIKKRNFVPANPEIFRTENLKWTHIELYTQKCLKGLIHDSAQRKTQSLKIIDIYILIQYLERLFFAASSFFC